MKIVAINGTPKKGNTWALYELLKSEYNDSVDFSQVHLYKENIPFCLGCNICMEKGEQKCPHSDIVQDIAQKIENADGIIIVSSTYSLGVNAVLKNFIDHMSYNFHRPNYPYKKAMIITSSAGSGQKGIAKYLREIMGHWNVNKTFEFSFISGTLSGYKPSEKVKDKFLKVADEFLQDVESKKLHSPSLKRLFYFGVWKAMAKTFDYETSADTRYWTDNQMMDLNYHKKNDLGYFKTFYAKATFGMMDKLFQKNKTKEY